MSSFQKITKNDKANLVLLYISATVINYALGVIISSPALFSSVFNEEFGNCEQRQETSNGSDLMWKRILSRLPGLFTYLSLSL